MANRCSDDSLICISSLVGYDDKVITIGQGFSYFHHSSKCEDQDLSRRPTHLN